MNISKLQLGTVQFGLDYGIANKSGKASFQKAKEIINAAFTGGITCFDTAVAYGNSEEVLGKALKELKITDKVTVVTKVPPLKQKEISITECEKFVFDTIDSSIKKLHLNKLPICLFHREEDLEYIDFLKKARERGLIESLGVSIDSIEYLTEILDSGVEYIQLPFNILDKRILESGLLVKAHEQGIKIFSRSVYLQGLLLMDEKNIISELSPLLTVRKRLQDIAKEAGMKMPELCMRYVLSFCEINSILTGVDTTTQLNENLELFHKGALEGSILKEINEAVPLFEEKLIRPALWPKSNK